MANEADVTIKLKAQDDASKTLNQVGESSTNMGISVQKAGMMAGAAMLAVGAAALKMSDDAREANATLRAMGLTLGETGDDLRELALEVANVTFELDSVIKTFDFLTRAGIKGQENLAESATAFDTLADAVGLSAESITRNLIPAFMMFDLDMTLEQMDRFTYLTKTTITDLPDFARMLNSSGRYMRELGLTADDLIVILKGLAEQGQVGRGANTALSTAMSQAADSGKDLYEELNLNVDALQKYYVEIENATGWTQKYADEMHSQYSIYDKAMQQLDEMKLKYGSMIEPLEGLFALMTALAPLLILVSLNATLAGRAITGLGVAIRFAWASFGPLLIAFGLLLLAGKLIIDNWDDIAEFAKIVWQGISDFIGTIVKGIVKGFNWFKDSALSIFEAIGKGVVTYIAAPLWAMITLIDKVIGAIQKIPVIGSRIPGLGAVSDTIGSIQDWMDEYSYLPKLAAGGIAMRPVAALIGEREPEAVIPLSRMGQMGGNITIPIYLDSRPIAEAVIDLTARSATMQGVKPRWT